MNNKLIFLNGEEIGNLITMNEAIDSMRTAFENLSEGKSVVPQRLHLNTQDAKGTFLIMPSYDPELGNAGIKTISLFKENLAEGLPTSFAMFTLFNASTGEPLALMEAETLTAFRTGAASGLATNLLARKNSSTAAIFGAGNQARSQLEAICSVRNISRAFLFNKNPESAASFIKGMSDKLNIEIIPAKNFSLLKEADIICTATPSEAPLFGDSILGEGIHINAVGSYKPAMIEISPETVKRSRLYVDSIFSSLQEAGEITQTMARGMMKESHIIGEIGQLAAGKIEGRNSDSDITLFKSVGSAVQDLFAASLVYKKALKNNAGTILNL